MHAAATLGVYGSVLIRRNFAETSEVCSRSLVKKQRAWARKVILEPSTWGISTPRCRKTFYAPYFLKLGKSKDARSSGNPATTLMPSWSSPITSARPRRWPPWTSASSSTRKWRLIPASFYYFLHRLFQSQIKFPQEKISISSPHP